jgi:hypothetical protein
LNSFSSNDRLMVASGKTPTISPSFRYWIACRYEPAPAPRSTGMWCMARISGPEYRLRKSTSLAMNRTSRLLGWAPNPPITKST